MKRKLKHCISHAAAWKTAIMSDTEASDISSHIDRVTKLSNLALLLYRWFVKNASLFFNEEDEAGIRIFFKDNLPLHPRSITNFYERLYLYQSYTWYGFIRQDFLMYYRYSRKWIDLFDETPLMMTVETGHYIKGMHNLLNAHFDLSNYRDFETTLKKFEHFSQTEIANRC